MATWQNPSGDIDFHGTRDSIITRALRICSAVADSETPTNSMLANGAEALNALVKQWDSNGIHLWTTTEGVVFLQPNQFQYILNSNLPESDNATARWRLSTLANSMAVGDTAVSLDTITNYGLSDIVIGDRIGIVLASGRVFWSLVTFPDPLTINDALTDSASIGAFVFLYRDKVEQPLRVISSRRFILSNRIETPMLVLSRLDYREMPNKETPGTITSFYYDPQLYTGYYSVWPAPSDVCSIVRITYYRRMQDLNDPNDTPDLPQEWTNALTWNLAREIAPEYDVPLQKYSGIIVPRAAETLDGISGWDREPESTYFGINFTPNSR